MDDAVFMVVDEVDDVFSGLFLLDRELGGV
jgi:hypothetical protein